MNDLRDDRVKGLKLPKVLENLPTLTMTEARDAEYRRIMKIINPVPRCVDRKEKAS